MSEDHRRPNGMRILGIGLVLLGVALLLTQRLFAATISHQEYLRAWMIGFILLAFGWLVLLAGRDRSD